WTGAHLNKQSSSERPEVGLLLDKSGSRECTGTLVASNVVLTAAHCVESAPGKFVVLTQDTHGAPIAYDYGVTDFVPYTDPNPAKGDTLRDLALVHLDRPVDPSIAKPDPLASKIPNDGSSMTRFGFGADVPLLEGPKRKFSFAYGATTRALEG